jgi:hypothetical protein
MLKRIGSVMARVVLVLAVSAALAQQAQEYFEIWTAADPDTDQDSMVSGDHSGLVGWVAVGANGNVQDDQLAGMAAPAVQRGTRFIWSFGQCFGGGMFDELVPLGGTQSGTAAARHDETAYYPDPNGVGEDWVNFYVMSMVGGANTARAMAAAAAADDPFGTNPNAARITEVMSSEHPQYFSVGAGADGLTLRQYRRTGIAILWSGQPKIYDRDQIVAALDALVAMGYARDRIFVFYGSGKLQAGHPIVQGHMANFNPPITLRAATRRALGGLFMMKLGAMARCRPDFAFFLANDHGYNTGVNNGNPVPRDGVPNDPNAYDDLDAEDDIGEYGDGDSDMYSLGLEECPCDGMSCEPDAGEPPDAGGPPYPDAGWPPYPDAGVPPSPDAGGPPFPDAGAFPKM